MTEVWDRVQEFLGHLEELDDPKLFSTGIRYVKDLIASIHDIDHRRGEGIAKTLEFKGSLKRIRSFIIKLERRKEKLKSRKERVPEPIMRLDIPRENVK